MQIRRFVSRPVSVEAGRYDGAIDSGDKLIAWVRRVSGNRQQLYFEDGVRLVLHGPDGTYDLFEGWWLVLDKNIFSVLSEVEFYEKYEG